MNTVGELIEELKTFPPETPITIDDGDGNGSVCLSFIGEHRKNPECIILSPGLEHYLNFGGAIEALKDGQRVSRSGWNGKGMWLWLVRKDEYRLTPPLSEENLHIAKTLEGGSMLPWIMMRTTQGDFVPWLASHTDMLANDWEVAATD